MSLEETTLKIMFSGLVVSILNHSFNFGEKYTKVVNSDFLEPKEKKKKEKKRNEERATIKDISVAEVCLFRVFVRCQVKVVIAEGKGIHRWWVTRA